MMSARSQVLVVDDEADIRELLGLTLARMSANAMDGDVLLESTGPEGSTFLWVVTRPVT